MSEPSDWASRSTSRHEPTAEPRPVLPRLVACPFCARHVRVHESKCPFCARVLPATFGAGPAPRRPPRMSRAALYALGSSLLGMAAATACGGALAGSVDVGADGSLGEGAAADVDRASADASGSPGNGAETGADGEYFYGADGSGSSAYGECGCFDYGYEGGGDAGGGGGSSGGG